MCASLQFVEKEAPAMDFLCSVCGKREGEPQGWRLVIEMSKPGTDIRNTFFIVDHWDVKRASEPNTTCLCCAVCEEKYLAARHRQLVA